MNTFFTWSEEGSRDGDGDLFVYTSKFLQSCGNLKKKKKKFIVILTYITQNQTFIRHFI